MVAHDPTARPSCGEILGELLQEGLWVRPTPAAVESVVCHLQKEVAGLKREVAEQEAEAVSLQATAAGADDAVGLKLKTVEHELMIAVERIAQ